MRRQIQKNRVANCAAMRVGAVVVAVGLSLLTAAHADGENLSSVTYSYDTENQLVSVATGGGTAEYTYDANGNRTAVTVVSGETVPGFVPGPNLWTVESGDAGVEVAFAYRAGPTTTGFRLEAWRNGTLAQSAIQAVGAGDAGSLALSLGSLQLATDYLLRLVEVTDGGEVLRGERDLRTPSGDLIDLAIERTTFPATLPSGALEVYLLTVMNHGDETAIDVVAEEVARGSLRFGAPQVFTGSVDEIGTQRLRWRVGDLAPGEIADLLIQVVASAEGEALLSATVASDSIDPELVNNRVIDRTRVTGGLPVVFTPQGTTITAERGDPVSLQVDVTSPTPVTWQWFFGEFGDRSNPLVGSVESTLKIPEFHHDGSYWVLATNGAGELEIGPYFLEAETSDTLFWLEFEDADGFAGELTDHPNWSAESGIPQASLLGAYFFDGGQALELGANGLVAGTETVISQRLQLGVATEEIWAATLDFARIPRPGDGGGRFGWALEDVDGQPLIDLSVDLLSGAVSYLDGDGMEVDSGYVLLGDRPWEWNLVIDFPTGRWSFVIGTSVIVPPTPMLSQPPAFVPGAVLWKVAAPDSVNGGAEVIVDNLRIRRLDELPRPEILAQPTDFIAFSGQVVGLEIEAVGEEPLTYRWYRGPVGDAENSTELSGSGNQVSFRTTENGETYWVEVSNFFGSTVSAPIVSVIEEAYIAYETDFAVDDEGLPFTVGQPIYGQNGWINFLDSSGNPITGGNRIVDTGNGDLALQLGGGSVAGSDTQWLGAPVPILGGFGANRQVSFMVEMTDPEIGNDDTFGIQIVNADYELLAQMDFNYLDTRIYASRFGDIYSTGFRWEPQVRYRVDIFIDGEKGSYSAYMNGAWVIRDEPLLAPSGGQAPAHFLLNWNAFQGPGTNTVLIDDFFVAALDGYVIPEILGMSPPVIVAQGESAEVQVEATGAGALSFAWYRGFPGDTSQPVGEDDPLLALADLAESGRYWVRVTNEVASVDSPSVQVAVDDPFWGQYDVASDTELAGFGSRNVAIDGNLAVVVGAQDWSRNIWILEKRDGQWFPLRHFRSVGTSGDEYGRSIALEDGVLAIGVPASNYPESRSGRVFLYTQDETDPTVWVGQNIFAPEPLANDRFGMSLDIEDGVLAVGATRPNTFDDSVGVVHLYRRDLVAEGTWSWMTSAQAADAGAGDWFGASVSLEGDRLAVGAPYHDGQESIDTDGRDSGAVFLFEKDAGGDDNWGEVTKVLPDIRLLGSEFGAIVDLAGDRLAVGAPRYEGQVLRTDEGPGQVFVFREDTSNPGTWDLEQQIADPLPEPDREFGGSLDLSPDGLLVVGQTGFTFFDGAPLGQGYGDGDSDPDSAISLFGLDPDGSGLWRHLQWPQRFFPERPEVASPHLIAMDGGDLMIGDASTERVYFFSNPTPDLPPKLQREAFELASYDKNTSAGDIPGVRLGDFLDGWIIDGDNGETGIVLSFEERNVAGSWQFQRAGESFWRLMPPVSPIAGLVLRMDDRIRFLSNRWAFGEAAVRFRGWSEIAAESGEILRVDGYDGPGELTTGVGRLTVNVIDTNAYPRFATFAPSEAVAGFPFEYRIVISDDDTGQPIAITVEEKPEWLTFIDFGDRTALLSGDPTESELGEWTVRLRAFDGESGPVEQAFTITVNPAGQTGWTLLDTLVPEREITGTESVTQFSQALDGDTLAVATAIYPNPSSGGYNLPGQHQVIIYDRDPVSGEYVETRRVPPPPGGFRSRGYGDDVALDGDILAVSDTEWSNPDSFALHGESWRGRVLIHGRHVGGTNNWGLLREVTPSDPFPFDEFGKQLFLDNGVLVVIADQSSASRGSFGSVHVFERDQGGYDNWGQVANIVPSDAGLENFHTSRFAASATTIMYGETKWPFDVDWDDPQYGTGRIHIFSHTSGGGWSYNKAMASPSTIQRGGFGQYIHLSGDRLVVSGFEEEWGTRIYQEDLGGTDNWGFVQQIDARANGIDLRGDRLVLNWGGLRVYEDNGSGFEYIETLGFGYQSREFGSEIDQTDDLVIGGGGDVGPSQRIGIFGIGVRNIAPTYNGLPMESMGVIPEDPTSETLLRFRVGDLVAGRATDFNGDPIGLAVGASSDVPANGSWHYREPWSSSTLSISSSSPVSYRLLSPEAEIWFTPWANSAGEASPPLEIRAWDMRDLNAADFGGSSSLSSGAAMWSLRVEEIPDAPEFVEMDGITLATGEVVDVLAEFTDVDEGDLLSIEAEGVPAWMIATDLGDGTMRLVGAPPPGAIGFHRVRMTATDSYGVSSVGEWEVAVFEPGELGDAIIPDGLASNESFGNAIAVDGDTLAISSLAKKIYLFSKDPAAPSGWAWFQTKEDSYGTTMALDGGVFMANDQRWTDGRYETFVRVYHRDEGGANNWGFVQELSSGNGPSTLGEGIVLDGDRAVIGDSVATVGGITAAGNAYVYERDVGTGLWSRVASLSPGGFGNSANFGRAVALSGDVVAVASRKRNDGSDPTDGYVFLFEKDEGGTDNWGQVELLQHRETGSSGFGSTLVVDDDFLAVGVPAARSANSNYTVGEIAVFTRPENGEWIRIDTIGNPYSATGGALGRLNGNRTGLFALVESVTDRYGQNAVLEFRPDSGESGGWSLAATYHNHVDTNTSTRFGRSLAVSADEVFAGVSNYRSETEEPVSSGGLVVRFQRSDPALGLLPLQFFADRIELEPQDAFLNDHEVPEYWMRDLIPGVLEGRNALSPRVAVVALDPTAGELQYRDGSGSWTSVPVDVTEESAFIFPGNSSTRIRFVPSGQVGGRVEFATLRGVADASIASGERFAIAPLVANGLATSTTIPFSIEIIPTNGSPILTSEPIDPVLSPLGSPPDERGVLHVGAFMDAVASDPDPDDEVALALQYVSGDSNTAFEVSEDGGTTWRPLDYESGQIRGHFSRETQIRYVGNRTSDVELRFYAWDQTERSNSPSSYGGSSAYSRSPGHLPFAFIDDLDPPVIELDADAAAIPGEPYVAGFALSDPDVGDTVFAELVDAPDWLSAVQEGSLLVVSGMVPGDASGSFTIRVRATDSTELSSETTHAVTVIDEFSRETGVQLPAANLGSLSLSVSGDGIAVANDFAQVGSMERAGEVYIIRETGNGSGWEIEKILRAPVVTANGYFGNGIKLVGDRLFVAARRETDNTSATLIFERDLGGTNNWGLRKRISPSVGVITDGETLVQGVRGGFFSGNSRTDVYSRNSGGTNNWGLSHTAGYSGTSLKVDGEFFVASDLSVHRQSSGWEEDYKIVPEGVSYVGGFRLRDGYLYASVQYRSNHPETPSANAILQYDLRDGGELEATILLGLDRFPNTFFLTPDGNRLVVRIQVNGRDPVFSDLVYTRTEDDTGEIGWDLTHWFVARDYQTDEVFDTSLYRFYTWSSSEGNRIRMIDLIEFPNPTPEWIDMFDDFNLPEQFEDYTAPGYRVFDLIQFEYEDTRGNLAAGLAITGWDDLEGRLQVRHRGAESWVDVPELTNGDIYLVAPLDEIRYNPDLHANGDFHTAFTARLWGRQFDEPGYYPLGDQIIDAIGRDERSWGVTVEPTNDRPTGFGYSGETIHEGRDLETGDYFVEIPVEAITRFNATDVDGDPKGLALTELIDDFGPWEYRTSTDGPWLSVDGPVSETSALLVPEDGALRLWLGTESDFSGYPALRYRVWDQVAGAAGDRQYLRSVDWDTADTFSRSIYPFDIEYLPRSILRVESNPSSDLIGVTGTGVHDPGVRVPVRVDVPRFYEFQGWTGDVDDPMATETSYLMGEDATITAELTLKPFYAWWTNHLKELQNADLVADRDRDGVVDLMEYFIDGDPDRFDILDVRGRLMPDRRFSFDLTMLRSDLPPGVTVMLLGSNNLVDWEPVGFTREVVDRGDGRFLHAFIQTQKQDEGGKPFLKLQVREE